RRRRKIAMRLAQRQIRVVVADHSLRAGNAPARQGCCQSQARNAGDDADDENRHQSFAASARRSSRMKYLCLVYLEEEKLHAVPDKECANCGAGFRRNGMLIAAEALQPVET